MGKSFSKEFAELMDDFPVSFLIVAVLIFILGEIYALFFIKGNIFLMWLPAVVLAGVLFYKALK